MTDEKVPKFQVSLIVREFVDTGETIELQPIADYQESCWGWEDAKKTIKFFTQRVGKKIKDDYI